MHADSNRAPVAPALTDPSRSRTGLVAPTAGLEPAVPFGITSFQDWLLTIRIRWHMVVPHGFEPWTLQL